MSINLIELGDGLLVEVNFSEEQAEKISGGFIKKVNATFDNILPVIIKCCNAVMDAWQNLSTNIKMEKSEIEFGLGFEGEGNIFITRSKAKANVSIKITIKPNE